MRYIIAYDIEEDAPRTKLANLLLDYGDRIQKSVFEADLSAQDLQDLLRHASQYVDDADSLRVYPLCNACAKGVHNMGREPAPLSPDCTIV